MIIAMTGYTDKRYLLYPLLKVLQAMGDTLLISDDRRFLRLTENGENPGHLQNTMIYVTDSAPEDVWGELQQEPADFTHVVYDVKQFLPEDKLDLVLICETMGYEDGEEDFLSLVEGRSQTVHFAFDKKRSPDKDVLNLFITPEMVSQVEFTEVYKLFQPVTNADILKILAAEIGPDLGLTRSTLSKVLKGGVYE